jgi:hypothetical protein
LAVHENSQENPFFFLAVRKNSQVNPSFTWRYTRTAKETDFFLGGPRKQPRKHAFFLAVRKNSQAIIFSLRFVVTAKKTLYTLAAQFWPPRKTLGVCGGVLEEERVCQ